MTKLLPAPPARVHFVGIGGIGMSGLARILAAWGYTISGSDAIASPLTAELASEAMAITIGHTAISAAAEAALVVATAAVPVTNPELVAAREAGVPVLKRAALLGMLANARRGVAVAGTHGKSTTSGMVVTALRALGADPSYAIGAVLGATGTNAAPSTGSAMVVEADEYDYSFLHLTPEVAVITNIEFDHPDLFPNQDAYDEAFARFVAGIRREGTLVIAADDPGCDRLRRRADFAPPARLATFGEAGDADWILHKVADGWQVRGRAGVEVALPIQYPGRHNARNAAAAFAAVVALGYDPPVVAAAVGGFTGLGRRFEAKGEAAGVTVIDEYAHHPTEIRASLAAARERFPGRRLWAVFQPHTFSRTKALLPDFGAAFAGADRVMILDVYAAREVDDLGISAADLLELLPPDAVAAGGPADAAAKLATLVAPGDVVLTLGAGTITEAGPLLLERLRAHHARPASAVALAAPSRTTSRPAATRPRRSGAGESGPTIPEAPHLKVLLTSPMSLHTTWRVGGPADVLVRAPTVDDLRAAVAWGIDQGLPVTVIGGGSNLLVGDGGIRGLVVLARTPGERADGLVTVEDVGDAVRLRVAAQAPLSWTGRYAAERGWAGLDWGVGLPGTIGGATVNNAGAHGTEQKDHLEHVVVLDNETGEISSRPAAWLEAAYRHTVLKAAPQPRPLTVLEVSMLLPKGDPVELVRLADEHAEFRKLTQPTGACAGSTFANPPDDFAGRLLEVVGMKGYRVGGAAFSPKHSNWIVNDQKASAADVRELIATARRRVREMFDIELRQEIEELGEF
jgi:UDP-N-acetylmuramate--L-alanine ligase/UDP-N-acetylenolpyruvoylglucosamine reductase